MTDNVAASIKARLLNVARRGGEEFELFLVRYASERFLFRLGASPVRDRCILKGAGLLALWMPDPYRATRDLDFLAHGPSDVTAIRTLIATICAVPCAEDGLTFDAGGIQVTPIRIDEEYEGQRVILSARLGTARIRLQIDLGFGDAVVPPPEEADYPTLLPGLPPPQVRAYHRTVSVAEKFEAMVQLGRRNSRMKDFHDVWALSSAFAFDGPTLRRAVVACFERRRVAWTPDAPDVLLESFYTVSDLLTRWRAYLRAGAFQTPPPADFAVIGERVRTFLGPIRMSIVGGSKFARTWKPGGGWE